MGLGVVPAPSKKGAGEGFESERFQIRDLLGLVLIVQPQPLAVG